MNLFDWLSIVAILVCLLLSFLLRRKRDRADGVLARPHAAAGKTGNRRAAIVNRLLEARERLIGALLLGNNAVNILASSLATSVFLIWFGDVGGDLRDRDDDGAGRGVRRGTAQDRGDQRRRPLRPGWRLGLSNGWCACSGRC